jgi:hypothetical protein
MASWCSPESDEEKKNMKNRIAMAGLVACLIGSAAASAETPKLAAADIVARNVAARGGLEAWRAVHTLTWTGTMEAGGNDRRTLRVPGMPPQPPASKPAAQVQLPFEMDLARTRKSRLEIQFAGQTAVQVYDGAQGWKLRPYLNRHEVEPFAPAELEAAGMQSDLDGALVDYAAKGTKVDVEGIDSIDGHDAYRLRLKFKNQHVVHTWVDAQSFLEVKIEGMPRRLDGKPHPVAIFLRDYRSVGGLKMPYVIETVVQGVQRTEKIAIDKVIVNPVFDAARFSKPS